MRILIHDYIAYPFTVQLARALASRDHEVTYLHGGGVRSTRAAATPRPTDPPNLEIASVDLHEPLRSRAGPRRLLQERRYGARLAERIRTNQADVVLAVPSSLDAQAQALKATRETNGAFVFWLQDLYSHAIERLLGRRVPIAGRVLASRFTRLERQLLREADAVVAISEDFVPILRTWDAAGRVTVIPNWAPLDEVGPTAKANPWAQAHGLDQRPTLLYSGTLGRKHDPGLLLALADAMPDASVVVVSEGAGTDRLRKAAEERTRQNLVLLPLQPIERLGEVLASADVLVAILDPDASIFSVPSKVLTYLTAGRPILAAIPGVNQAARTVIESRAGTVVEPGNIDGFVAAAKILIGDEAAGQAARAYAERNFDIAPIAGRFEAVLRAAVQEGHSNLAARTDTAGAR